MFEWWIDKKLRGELDDLYSDIKKIKASIEALETNMTSLRAAVSRAKMGKQKSLPLSSSESDSPIRAGMTREMQEWIAGTMEYKQGIIPTESINNEDNEEE